MVTLRKYIIIWAKWLQRKWFSHHMLTDNLLTTSLIIQRLILMWNNFYLPVQANTNIHSPASDTRPSRVAPRPRRSVETAPINVRETTEPRMMVSRRNRRKEPIANSSSRQNPLSNHDQELLMQLDPWISPYRWNAQPTYLCLCL